MENATQALFIATGVLIGVIILSLAIYLFSVFGGYAANTQKQIDANEIAEFNNKFLKYSGLTDLTIQDVITVKNYALENNKEDRNYNAISDACRAGDNNDYIDVFYKNLNETEKLIYSKNDEDLLKESLNRKYTCKVFMNNNTKRVNKICFYEIKSTD